LFVVHASVVIVAGVCWFFVACHTPERIADARVQHTCSTHMFNTCVWFVCVWFVCVVWWCVCGVHRLSGSGVWWWLPVWWLLLWVGVGLVVCVTSCEGHMVDALASRADEGRRSLR
jgi:hypothetical protein